ncbi:hypothetical protein BC834DRAFT_892776 [Gloeopeniophorella convolvens]|nr:hypothetical protein BC834DRAFT_892776 [Gloeopeniophorella convolvens]
MRSLQITPLAVLPLLVQLVRADTSLFIPGFDPQPLSVGNLGTDGQGRTTWEIVPGSLTGTFDEPAFIGTATLVEGPNDAHLNWINNELSVTLDIQCGIAGGLAACTGNQGYEVTPLVFPTAPLGPFIVQGGGPVSAPPAAPSSSPSPPPSPGSAAPSSSPTSSSTSSSASSSSSGFVTSSIPTPAPTPTAGSSSNAGSGLNPAASTTSNNAGSSIVVRVPLVVLAAVGAFALVSL